MPYISKTQRRDWDSMLHFLEAKIQVLQATKDPINRAGEINYLITSILLLAFPEQQYSVMALVDGIIANVGREYYRRRTASYEDEKIKDNGDIPGYSGRTK